MRELGRRKIPGGLVVFGCAVMLAACGWSHKPSGASELGVHSEGLAFANCMRGHGVPSFPDPSGGGGGTNLGGTGINPLSPAFKSARQKCAKLAPGGPGGVQATERQFLAALRFAKCMREHGFAAFPDPTRSDTPPGPILIIGQGLFFRVSPGFDPTTPIVKRAVAACGVR